MSYADHVREDCRLVILRLLNDAPAYTANSSVIDTFLHKIGHRITRAQIKGELAWLDEQGLIITQPLDEVDLVVATLTGAGRDVATGEGRYPGVARPSPR